ncbi:MAG: PAS domain S-box protein [Acidobacteriia bacterium]|nr:PAS domain S-box protein [Terriglobia bacterium]
MPPETKLRNRIAELEARVAEADETLRAIRNGEVDAFVVAGNRGERVYTLTGADQTYRILIEEMREGALTLSADGLILYSNRRFAELIGLPLEQVSGTFLGAYAAERDGERVTAMLRRQANEPNRGEITLMHADGRPIPTFFAINELEIDGARLLCLVVTDLTEQKHAEEIVAAEMLARAIFDQAAEAIVVVDQEGAIVRASQAAHKLAGDNVLFRKFEDALPLRFLETSTFKDGGALRAAACAGRTIKGVEATLPRGADRPVSVLVSAGPLTGEGHETLGCVMTITDITLRKLVEERIRQSQKMESLGRLAGGIAHDFNNLLTGIVGNASLISDMVGEEAKSSLEDIIASGQRAAELTRQLLAYAGKGRFFMERLDLSAVVEHTLPLIRPSLPKKVELSTDLCADAPRFEADRNQIQQVVLNLVLNAGEAIGDRPGRITIQTGVREGRVAEAQGKHELARRRRAIHAISPFLRQCKMSSADTCEVQSGRVPRSWRRATTCARYRT